MSQEEYIRVRFQAAVNTQLGDTVRILGDQSWVVGIKVTQSFWSQHVSYPIWQTAKPLRLQKGVY